MTSSTTTKKQCIEDRETRSRRRRRRTVAPATTMRATRRTPVTTNIPSRQIDRAITPPTKHDRRQTTRPVTYTVHVFHASVPAAQGGGGRSRCRQITTPTPHHSISTCRMLFLTPDQQCQSTEAKTPVRKSEKYFF